MTVDILCRVVDNYGDIGVLYRLARALAALGTEPRLVVDDLDAFRRLCPRLDPSAAVQTLDGLVVVASGDARSAGILAAHPPRLVVEGFACGRPDWYEALLFDEADAAPRLLVDLEYLSAEAWVADFHRTPSLTRSSLVRKAIFMPGFVEGTGGLTQDPAFMAALSRRDSDAAGLRRDLLARIAAAAGASPFDGPALPGAAEDAFWVPFFTYDRDCSALVEGFSRFAQERPLLVLAAAGRSQGPFRDAWEQAGRPFSVLFLPFLDQETWDALLAAADLSVVRGEDSLSRAALAGRPFLWQVYLIDGGHHEPKARAFLDLLSPRFRADAFAPLDRVVSALSCREYDGPGPDGSFPPAPEKPEDVLAVLRLAAADEGFRRGFSDFSASVRSVGDLARNLLTFMRDFV